MADRFWVGGTGNWSDNTHHWSDTSGGSPGASKPTSADNVYFDANSFNAEGQTVTINETAYCLDIDWTGATNTPELTGSGSELDIYGSLTFIEFMSVTMIGYIFFNATSTGKNVNVAGKSLPCQLLFYGDGGGWTLQGDIAGCTRIQLSKGTLNTNGKSVSTITFDTNNSNVRSLILGSTTLTILNYFSANTITNLTFDPGTSTIVYTGNTKTFFGGGATYNNVRFRGTPTTVSGSNTFNTLTVDSGKTCKLTAGTDQNITALSWDGATIESTSAGSAAKVSVASGTVTMTGGSLKDNTAEGGATFNAVNVTDVSGNTGWNFITTGGFMTCRSKFW